MKRSLRSRLDKHCASMSALAAAATLSGAAQNAGAAIVYHASANVNIPSSFYGVYLNMVTSATTNGPGGPAGWDVNPYGITYLRIFAPGGGGVVLGGGTGTDVANLAPGTTIGPSSTYGGAQPSPNCGTTGAFPFVLGSQNNLVGFKFVNEAIGGQTQYGWMRISLAAGSTGAQPRTIVEWAYEDTGIAIAAGATVATGSGACCLGTGGCTANQTPAQCTSANGVWAGNGVTCALANCPQPGACCMSAGLCTAGMLPFACASAGGVYAGAATTCAAANCPKLYFSDDGAAEDAVGTNATVGDIAFANQFVSTAGATTITNIQIAFGNDATLNGLPVTAYLWSDPDQNGDPTDAHVLASATGVVSGATQGPGNPTPTYVTFDIPDTAVPVGQKFFVGFVITAGQFPGALDTNVPHHTSWLANAASGAFNPNAWPTAVNEDTIAPGNWLIRAAAAGSSGSTCYANCDASTAVPFLNVQDFSCFLQKFAAADPYANCDASTQQPVLNVQDFSCFLQKFAAGCSAP